MRAHGHPPCFAHTNAHINAHTNAHTNAQVKRKVWFPTRSPCLPYWHAVNGKWIAKDVSQVFGTLQGPSPGCPSRAAALKGLAIPALPPLQIPSSLRA